MYSFKLILISIILGFRTCCCRDPYKLVFYWKKSLLRIDYRIWTFLCILMHEIVISWKFNKICNNIEFIVVNLAATKIIGNLNLFLKVRIRLNTYIYVQLLQIQIKFSMMPSTNLLHSIPESWSLLFTWKDNFWRMSCMLAYYLVTKLISKLY